MFRFLTITFAVAFTRAVSGQSIISEGKGFGTYYFDVDSINACRTTFENITNGGVRCGHTTLLSLNDLSTNSVVAMNNTQLGADLALYCGKRVIVSVNNQELDIPLFIGDGCERCSVGSSFAKEWNPDGAPGLDFSYTVLNKLAGGKACDAGYIDIAWKIVDETLHPFDVASTQLSKTTSISKFPLSVPTQGITSSRPCFV